MRRFWIFSGGILVSLLVMFLVFEQLGLSLFDDPDAWIHSRTGSVAAAGVGLLVLDVVLPVPSSLVMIAHGAIFGLVLGTLLSLIGSTGAALVGFTIGRFGSSVLVPSFIPTDQMAVANSLFGRWGMVAVVVTRPIPLLAETTAIVAGTSRLSYGQMTIATIAGSLPAAALYALTGSIAVSLNSTVLGFGLVVLIAGLFWLLRRPVSAILGVKA